MLRRGRERHHDALRDERDRMVTAFAIAQSPKAMSAWAARKGPQTVAQYKASKAKLRALVEGNGAFITRVH